MIAFQRNVSKSLGKTFLGCRRTSAIQRDRERIYNCNFSKANVQSRGRTGANHQVLAGRNSQFSGQPWVFPGWNKGLSQGQEEALGCWKPCRAGSGLLVRVWEGHRVICALIFAVLTCYTAMDRQSDFSHSVMKGSRNKNLKHTAFGFKTGSRRRLGGLWGDCWWMMQEPAGSRQWGLTHEVRKHYWKLEEEQKIEHTLACNNVENRKCI